MDNSTLKIGTEVETSGIQAGMSQSASAVEQNVDRIKAAFEASMAASTAAVKALEAEMVGLKSKVAALEASLQSAGQGHRKFSGDTVQSQQALHLLGNMMGIEMPRFVRSYIGSLEGVAPVMSAAFAPLMVLEMGKLLAEIPAAVQKMVLSMEGFGEESQKAFEKATKSALKWQVDAIETLEKLRNISLIGADGMKKWNLETVINSENIKEVSSKIDELSQKAQAFQKIADHKSASEKTAEWGTPQTKREAANEAAHFGGGIGHSAADIQKAKDSLKELDPVIAGLRDKLRELHVKQKEISAQGPGEVKKELITTQELAEKRIENEKQVATLSVSLAEQTARQKFALGRATVDVETAELLAAEDKRFAAEVSAAQQLNAIRAKIAGEEGKPAGPGQSIQALGLEHQIRAGAILGKQQEERLKEQQDLDKIVERSVDEQIKKATEGWKEAQKFIDEWAEKRKQQAEAVAKIEHQSEIEQASQTFAYKRELLDEDVAQHKITVAEKIADLKRLQEAEYAAQKAAAIGELNDAVKDKGAASPEAASAKAKLESLQATNAIAMEKLNAQAQSEFVKPFITGISDITNAFDSGLNSWITGQKKFGTAMQQMWRGVVNDALKAIEQIAEKFVVKEAVMALAHKMTQTQQAATDAAAAGASTGAKAVQVAANVALATSAAGVASTEAAAGVAAASGPAAPITGPAAAAAMMASLAPFIVASSFEVGGVVPRTQMALVHGGERVLTESQNKSLERGLNGGGGDGGSTFNYHAAPGESPDSVTRNADALRRAARDGGIRW